MNQFSSVISDTFQNDGSLRAQQLLIWNEIVCLNAEAGIYFLATFITAKLQGNMLPQLKQSKENVPITRITSHTTICVEGPIAIWYFLPIR